MEIQSYLIYELRIYIQALIVGKRWVIFRVRVCQRLWIAVRSATILIPDDDGAIRLQPPLVVDRQDVVVHDLIGSVREVNSCRIALELVADVVGKDDPVIGGHPLIMRLE